MRSLHPLLLSLLLVSFLAFFLATDARAQESGSAQPPPSTDPAAETATSDATATVDPSASEEPDEIVLEPPADPDLEGMEESVQERLREERAALMNLLQRPDVATDLLAEAMGEMGFVYQAHGLDEAAAVSYRNAIRLAPEDFRWLHALGGLLYRANDLERASAIFQRSLQIEQRNLAAWLYLTEILLTQDRADDAAQTVANAAALSDSSPAVLDLLGRVAMARDEPEKAVEAFEFALAQVPEANRLHYQLAMAYRSLENMDKAREHLALAGKVGVQIPDPMQREIEERKSGERLLLLEGRRAFNAGAYADAADAFRRALESQPGSLTARVNLASALALSGEAEKAVAEFEAVLEEDPERHEARFNLGSLLVRAGRPGEALEHLQTVLAESPDDLEAARELGVAYRDLGRMQEAEEMLRQVTDRSNDERATIALGETMVRQLRYAEAKEFLMNRYLMNPQAGPVAAGLARLLAAAPVPGLRDGAKALTLAQRQMEAEPIVRNAETLAMALAESGRCADAAEIQRQILAADGIAPERLGELAQTLGRYAEGPPCRPPFPTDVTPTDSPVETP